MSGLGWAILFAACMLAVFAKWAWDRHETEKFWRELDEQDPPTRDWLWPPREALTQGEPDGG